MPTHDFKNIGEVLDFNILRGVITEIDPETDTCKVEVNDRSLDALLFYHCKPDSEIRDNGAIKDAANGFGVNDSVIVMIKKDESVIKVIAHTDGVRHCDDLLFKFTFNGEEANLGGEVLKIYYHPLPELEEPCNDVHCLIGMQDGEKCQEIYCLSKSAREEAFSNGDYDFPDDWSELDLRGIPLTPFFKKDIDTDYPIRIVLSDKRQHTTEVHAHYENYFRLLCTELGLSTDDPYSEAMFLYKFNSLPYDPDEPVPNADLPTTPYVPMYEGFTYSQESYQDPENYDYGTITVVSNCGGTPEGWWDGFQTTSDSRAYTSQRANNLVHVQELTVWEGTWEELQEDAEFSGVLISVDGRKSSPKVVEIDVTCPENLYRIKSVVDTIVDDKSTLSVYWGPHFYPGWRTIVNGISRVGDNYAGVQSRVVSCKSTLIPDYGTGYIDNYNDLISTGTFSGGIYPHISECDGGGTASFSYSWIRVLTSIDNLHSVWGSNEEYTLGGRSTQTTTSSVLAIPVFY